ncbi:hypothetical protein EGH57_22250 [Klebsiella aerogenes]|nr:hypothetical protein EGH57_22250 [Klebsiella aerogenes]
MALRLPGLQTASTYILPGGAALTGPTNGINLKPARWRYAYRAYKPHQPTSCPVALRLPGLQTASTYILPGGAALTGPTNGINLKPARWRCVYRADKPHQPTSCPVALRLPGLQTASAP